VTVYQPLVALQRPTAIDTDAQNFERQRMLIRCIPSDGLKPDDAQLLCGRLRTLFTSQGAQVEVEVPQRGGPPSNEAGAAKPDLIVDLKGHLVNSQDNGLLWIVCALTFTLVPAVSEYTYAQDMTIRDANGFQLASDRVEARFVRYFGVGIWAVNSTLDLLVRSEDEKLTGEVSSKDFSRDFYRQISQVAFNASMRALVMRSFDDDPLSRPAPTPPPESTQ
jgi:hypothetical protein